MAATAAYPVPRIRLLERGVSTAVITHVRARATGTPMSDEAPASQLRSNHRHTGRTNRVALPWRAVAAASATGEQGDHLDRDVPAQLFVLRLPDLPHSALAELPYQPVPVPEELVSHRHASAVSNIPVSAAAAPARWRS